MILQKEENPIANNLTDVVTTNYPSVKHSKWGGIHLWLWIHSDFGRYLFNDGLLHVLWKIVT
jgi:hypothetical protein